MIFQNFPNTTRRFAAREILENVDISFAVLLPNTTTGHAITYTNTLAFSVLPGCLFQPWMEGIFNTTTVFLRHSSTGECKIKKNEEESYNLANLEQTTICQYDVHVQLLYHRPNHYPLPLGYWTV